LSQWFRFRTKNARGTRKTMIVALARKLLIALWRFARTGELPEGVGSDPWKVRRIQGCGASTRAL
jgi:hypothetical protein